MSKLIVKILVGLVTVISVLGLFSFTVIKLSNYVRFEHYWTELVSPPLAYLAAQENEALLDKQSNISVMTKKEAGVSELSLARLDAGQVVLEFNDDELLAWFLYQDEQLIRFQSDLDEDGIHHFYLQQIMSALQSSLEDLSGAQLDDISEQFSVYINKITNAEKRQVIERRLAEKAYHVSKTSAGVSAVLSLSDGQIFEVIFPEEYSVLSWPILLFLFVFTVGLLVLISYLLIQRLERRLRNIQTAASRISRGELDARVSNAGDDDSISRLGDAFNSMADHIQRLMLVQKEMIHAVSHELRTPVARIRFGVQMIEDCPGQEALQKQVRGIDGDIQELDELIDEILTYARLEQGGPILAFQEADVSAIVEQVVLEQGGVKPEMHIFSEYKEDSDVWKISEVEARYIHRSIQNLVGNATRYANSKVKVVCAFDSETCRIDVEDDGPGIPESDWESVFTPFARLDDSRTRSSGGYGLGLSIVRRILYWHGGQAFLSRSDMGGAKFSLVWPRSQVKD